jgi:hypothetical protein
MKNLAPISKVLTAFYNGTIESVSLSFIHPEYGMSKEVTYKSAVDFIKNLTEVYDYGFDIEFTMFGFTGLEVEFLSEETDEAMQAFGVFLNNWNSGFIQKVWGEGALSDHLNQKWNGYYQQHGAGEVVRKFYSELSGNNRSLLNAYIVKHHAKSLSNLLQQSRK